MSVGIKRSGQVSMEVMYAVGVLLVIFLILSGVSFNKKLTVAKTEDFLKKRDECLMLSNKLSEIATLGEGYYTTFKTLYNVTIWGDGLILVSDVNAKSTDQEVYCTFVGNTTNLTGVTGWYDVSGYSGTMTILKCPDQVSGACTT